MDFLNLILNISKPTGFWGTIINAFESGLGSYLLAIIFITLIVKILLSPFDTINKRMSKKQINANAKLQPEMEKIQKKYGHDKALYNQKTQELYKKAGMSVGGSCLFMIIFMVINLTVFFTLFSSLNLMADYKINQQYLSMKDGYSNVLNLVDNYGKENGNLNILDDYENVKITIEDGFVKALDVNNNEIYKTKYVDDYSYYKQTTETLPIGDITTIIVNYDIENEYTRVKINKGTESEPVYHEYYILTEKINESDGIYTISEEVNLYNFVNSDEYILYLVRTYTSKEDSETPKYIYKGDEIVTGEVTVKDAIQTIAMKEVIKVYDETQKENSFLWIGSIWIADSPFKSSIFTFDQYKNEIGAKNVSEQENVIYDSFMNDLRTEKGRVNGYYILALLSIALSFLSSWLMQKSTKSKNSQPQKINKLSLIIMPLIMGLFAILYNSVFAIYLITNQLISIAISPISNLIIEKMEKHDQKKEEAKKPVVDYRRK